MAVSLKLDIDSSRSDESEQQSERTEADSREQVGVSPIEVQVRFLESLADDPDHAERFLDNPVDYARENGVHIDPGLARDIADAAIFGANFKERLSDYLRRSAEDELSATGTSEATDDANPRKALQGTTIQLPNGRVLTAPNGMAASLVTDTGTVAVYGTLAIGSLRTAAATDRTRLTALRRN